MARARLDGALFLSDLLRSKGVKLPTVLAHDTADSFPWMALERLEGSDLENVVNDLTSEQLKQIAVEVLAAQKITAEISGNGRFGYAVRPDEAPYGNWSDVLQASIDWSNERIANARRVKPDIAKEVQAALTALRSQTNKVEAVALLHDTTTKNVIVGRNSNFSGIVDVDDLCFGDPRYAIALTMAALTCYVGPTSYAAHWLAIADLA